MLIQFPLSDIKMLDEMDISSVLLQFTIHLIQGPPGVGATRWQLTDWYLNMTWRSLDKDTVWFRSSLVYIRFGLDQVWFRSGLV